MDKTNKYVSYCRVSTCKQYRYGYSIESQKKQIFDYITKDKGFLVYEFEEISSGNPKYQKEIHNAIKLCKDNNYTLIISKIDRLSRNSKFIIDIFNTVNIIIVDQPMLNGASILDLAIISEYESKLISNRTKCALKSAKDSGVKLGNPNPTEALKAAHLAIKRNKDLFNIDIKKEIDIAKNKGFLTLNKISNYLNSISLSTRRNGKWTATSVKRVLNS